MSIADNINKLKHSLPAHVTLVAVSKKKPEASILEAYEAGQRDFGENYIQELCAKAPSLPPDIRWHFIGHLQSNKVKYIAPFVHLIHGIDSEKLLSEVNRQGAKHGRIINCLLQIHIAREESKFGFSREEALELVSGESLKNLGNIRVAGLMGMATNTDDNGVISEEFRGLQKLREEISHHRNHNFQPDILSMGMSGDYLLAIREGSNMVRIGSLIFGIR